MSNFTCWWEKLLLYFLINLLLPSLPFSFIWWSISLSSNPPTTPISLSLKVFFYNWERICYKTDTNVCFFNRIGMILFFRKFGPKSYLAMTKRLPYRYIILLHFLFLKVVNDGHSISSTAICSSFACSILKYLFFFIETAQYAWLAVLNFIFILCI